MVVSALAIDARACGLTHCGGNPGRLTPTADPSTDGLLLLLLAAGGSPREAFSVERAFRTGKALTERCAVALTVAEALSGREVFAGGWTRSPAEVRRGVDRPGLPGGETRSGEGACPLVRALGPHGVGSGHV